MAQERCIRRTAQYGRLWEIGEVREVNDFNEEGDPVVSQHFRLVEDGEDLEDSKVFDKEDLIQKRREIGERDKTSAILHALNKLNPEDDGDWTSSGQPSVQRVHTLTDFDVSRADIQMAAPDFDRTELRARKRDAEDARARRAG